MHYNNKKEEAEIQERKNQEPYNDTKKYRFLQYSVSWSSEIWKQ